MTYRNIIQHRWVWYPSSLTYDFRSPASDHLPVSYTTVALLEGPATLDSSLERPESGKLKGRRQINVCQTYTGSEVNSEGGGSNVPSGDSFGKIRSLSLPRK